MKVTFNMSTPFPDFRHFEIYRPLVNGNGHPPQASTIQAHSGIGLVEKQGDTYENKLSYSQLSRASFGSFPENERG